MRSTRPRSIVPLRSPRIDVAAPASDQDRKPAYTTSQQVQAWSLRRSRDLWKTTSAALQVELKRLRQRAADIDPSRDPWRGQAEGARRQVEELQAANARLGAAWDAATAAGGKKILPPCPR